MTTTSRCLLLNCLRICSVSSLLLCTSLQAADDNGSETLFALINERLSYMEQVALYKHQNNMAIEDLERERQVVDNSRLAAAQQGLDGNSVDSFFEAQIAVAKAIQYRHLADWMSIPDESQPPDLNGHLRPILTDLGDRIIANLAILLRSGNSIGEQDRKAFYERITVQHVEEADKAQLFENLAKVRIRTPEF